MNEFKDIVGAFAGKRVLIVGDLMLDEYVWSKVRRISPEAPVPVLEYERRTTRPGGAANAAANVLSLGGKIFLGGFVGGDAQGEQLLTVLRSAGLNGEGVIVAEERWTTTKTRLMVQNRQVVRLDYERAEPISPTREEELLRWVDRHNADAYVLSDYAKGAISPRVAQHVIQLARRNDKPVLVDPKGTDYTKYRGATLVKPNVHEVERVMHQNIEDEEDILQAGRRMMELLPASAVVITRGAQGISVFRDGAPPVHIPSRARHVFDVTGAGDTVTGVLALALAARNDVLVAARLANEAAGIVVGKLGTAQVSQDELCSRSGSG